MGLICSCSTLLDRLIGFGEKGEKKAHEDGRRQEELEGESLLGNSTNTDDLLDLIEQQEDRDGKRCRRAHAVS